MGARNKWHQCKPLIRHVNEFGLSKREQLFVDCARREAAEAGVCNMRVLVQAAIASDGNLIKYGDAKEALQKRRAMRKVRKLLMNPKVAEGIQDIFAVRGFDLTDAIDKMIAHINEGNYQALKDYMAMTLPQKPREVRIQQQTAILHAHAEPIEQNPTMEPRRIGAAKVLPE